MGSGEQKKAGTYPALFALACSGLGDPSSDFPIGGRHQRSHASRSSASGGVEKVYNSGTDVFVIFGNGCHPRHRDSFVLMADTVRALSHFHERRTKLD